MFRRPLYRTLWIVSVVVIGIVGGVSGQARSTPPPAGPATDELLAELRGLRAEINQAAGTSLRAQLLVARLQLQEQRIDTLARQLTDVQERLAGTERALAPMAAQLKTLEEPPSGVSPEQQRDMENVGRLLKGQFDQHRKAEQDLRAQEATLSGLLAEAQSRWADFNERLDELERMLPTRPR